MTRTESDPTIVLIPGHWLGAWAWEEVLAQLGTRALAAQAMTLPGLDPSDPRRATRTLDDQAGAIAQLLREATGPVILVAHSGANAPVSLVLDRHPELVARVVWVDSGPLASGSVFLPGAGAQLVELPLPSWEELGRQASLAGLSDEQLARFRERAVPEPGPVLTQPVLLTDPARLRVPTTFVCCSLSGRQVADMARAGHPMFAEVARLEGYRLIDLPTGHWPMWSRPVELARLIGAVATGEELDGAVVG